MIARVLQKHSHQAAAHAGKRRGWHIRQFCAGLAGSLVALLVVWSSCANAAEPRVLLLRGWFGVFSTGLDGIADAMKANGINAEVAGHLYWETAVAEIVRERAAGTVRPLVLVGHSQGANNVIDMAHALASHNVQVDLLVTLAPFMQAAIPGNVARAVNYYQSPGWGAPIAPDRGFRGKIENIDVSGDWTITHISIDKSSRIHTDIVREVVALARDGQPTRATRAAARTQ
jgi:hypothetical protein